LNPLPALPIDEAVPPLLAALREGPSAVLVAPTGAGKTTRVPLALLAAGLGGGGQVVMLEPRRIAARAAARRMAEETGAALGEEIGYQVRFDRKAGPRTKILVVTEGILVQRLQADPFLEGVGAVIFDELHERSLATDLSLAMARRVQREVRPDLKLLAMSATLDPGPIATFLGNAPTIESRGRLFPVDILYSERPDDRPLPARIAAGVRKVLGMIGGMAGDVLVFLPGVGEIQRCAEALAGLAAEQDLAVLPLYGDLPAERQDEVLRPMSGRARRKIVLATNVAETSLTIDGVTAVVDSGQVRRLRFDPATGLDRLELGKISRASAEQRAGRAGRQAPGICLRLWPAYENATLAERETPEIARVDLAGPALQLLAWGETDLAAFGWFEAPSPESLTAAVQLLWQLGAFDTVVTSLGSTMARLPVHPRLARLLIEGQRAGRTRDAALLAALLAERDPFQRSPVRGAGPRRSSRSDLLDRLDALESFERRDAFEGETLNAGAARFVLRARDQLAEMARRELAEAPGKGGGDDAHLLRALLAAYPDRVARRREPRSPRAVMVGGRGIRLAAESAVLEAELFLCVELDIGRGSRGGEALVRKASAVEPEWLDPGRLRTSIDLEFDEPRERVAAWKRTRYDDLVIAEAEVPAPKTSETERVLVQAATDRLDRALALDDPEVAGFLARVRSLADWRPELELPVFTDSEIRDLLPALAAGRKSFAELRRAPLLDVLQGALSYPQLAALRREAPERLEVPSGSHVELHYEPGKPPVLAARIQELFGLEETPRVAAGRIPVLLHLLAPNGRPQQVTHDLRSFWTNTYPEVRKELQGRYPRHSWPTDPWNARPERRPARKSK
jgi:ATP-dependent RNA helicase HrpB